MDLYLLTVKKYWNIEFYLNIISERTPRPNKIADIFIFSAAGYLEILCCRAQRDRMARSRPRESERSRQPAYRIVNKQGIHASAP